jgi:DNA-directed RNA polymerase subunit K/omega
MSDYEDDISEAEIKVDLSEVSDIDEEYLDYEEPVEEEEVEEEEVEAEAEVEDIEEEEEEDFKYANFTLRKKKITINILFKNEKARLLMERSQQLEKGAKPLVSYDDLDKNDIHIFYKIAVKELYEKKFPLKLERPHYPDKTYEIWDIKDLNIL